MYGTTNGVLYRVHKSQRGKKNEIGIEELIARKIKDALFFCIL